MSSRWAALLLASIILLGLAQAKYYIDDQNDTITYGSGWFMYPQVTIVGVKADDAHNKSYHVALLENRTTIDLQFRGHGITFYVIYVQHAYNTTADVSIDGGSPTSYPISSPVLFDKQELSLDMVHSLHVDASEWLVFDYLMINDTVANVGSEGKRHKINEKALLIGLLAAVSAILIGILILICRRRPNPPRPPAERPPMVELCPVVGPLQVVEQPPVVEPCPVVERPVVEQPVVEQPVVEQPEVEQPVVEQPVVERPPEREQPPEVERPLRNPRDLLASFGIPPGDLEDAEDALTQDFDRFIDVYGDRIPQGILEILVGMNRVEVHRAVGT